MTNASNIADVFLFFLFNSALRVINKTFKNWTG